MSRSSSIIASFFHLASLLGVKKRSIFLLLLLGVCSSVVSVTVPLVFGEIIDKLASIASRNTSNTFGILSGSLICPVVLFAILLVLSDVIRIFYGYSCVRLTNRLIVKARKIILQRTVSCSEKQKLKDKTNLSYLATVDCAQLRELYSAPLTTVVSDILDTLFICLVLATISWKILFVVIVPLVPIYLIAVKAGIHQRNLAKSIRQKESDISEHIEHLSKNWLVIKIFGGLRREEGRSTELLRVLKTYLHQTNMHLALLMLRVAALRTIATSVAIGLSVVYASRGEIAIGSIAMLMLYLVRFYSPALNLAKSYQSVQRGAVSAEKISDFIQRTNIVDGSDAKSLESLNCNNDDPDVGCLEWSNLTILLPSGSFINIPSLRQERAGLILLLGASGSGKSSFFKCLVGVGSRLQSGEITWNGQDINSLTENSRLALFSYAGQENDIFPGHIEDTIFYPQSPEEYARFNIDSYLQQLEITNLKGRILGKMGGDISGGEARRVVLARALVHEAPILLADEVTSNLDEQTREKIENVLIEESQRRIVIVIAHGASEYFINKATRIIDFSTL